MSRRERLLDYIDDLHFGYGSWLYYARLAKAMRR